MPPPPTNPAGLNELVIVGSNGLSPYLGLDGAHVYLNGAQIVPTSLAITESLGATSMAEIKLPVTAHTFSNEWGLLSNSGTLRHPLKGREKEAASSLAADVSSAQLDKVRRALINYGNVEEKKLTPGADLSRYLVELLCDLNYKTAELRAIHTHTAGK